MTEKEAVAAGAMLTALRVAQDVLQKHRLAGTDQNPRGLHDVIGYAITQAERAGIKVDLSEGRA